MERLFGVDKSRRKTEIVCVDCNFTYVEQSTISRSYMLTLIVFFFFFEAHTPAEFLDFHLVTEGPSINVFRNPEPTATDASQKCKRKRGRRGTRRENIRTNTIYENSGKRRADETAKELRASLPITTSSRANSSRFVHKMQKCYMLLTLLIRWCHVCSAQSGSQEMVTTMIRRVITARLKEIGAIRRKTDIFIRTNEVALFTIMV